MQQLEIGQRSVVHHLARTESQSLQHFGAERYVDSSQIRFGDHLQYEFESVGVQRERVKESETNLNIILERRQHASNKVENYALG